MSKATTPNPNGKKGEPITLAPYSFDDALRKIQGVMAEPMPDAKLTAKKPQKKHTK